MYRIFPKKKLNNRNYFREEFIRSTSSGKLKFTPETAFDFKPSDLEEQCVIGEGAFGTVLKMMHKTTGHFMAVKVGCFIIILDERT